MGGRLGAYLVRYQLRDFLLLRAGLPTFIVVFFCWMIVKTDGARMVWASPDGQRMARDLFRVFGLGMFVNLAAFLGIARLVSDDRSNGYFRFLFSKPASIERFYAQQWLLHGAGFVALVGILGLWLQSVTAPIPIREGMIVMGLTWILIGGVGFALGAFTNADAVLLLLLWIGSKIAHTVKDSDPNAMWPLMRQLTRLSLPTHKLDYVSAQLLAGNPLPVSHTLHVLAYGLLAFIVAVVLLRRRSFA